MMPMAKKKPSALVVSILAGKGKGPAGEEEAPESGEEEMDVGSAGGLAAAKDMLAAIKAGDAQALSDALQAHYDCCGSDEE